MVFNPVFFETNETGELAYFARPQKISNANYLFADIMSVMSQNNAVVSKGEKNSAETGSLNGATILTESVGSKGLEKLLSLFQGIFLEKNIPTSASSLKISKEQLNKLFAQIGELLGKEGQSSINTKELINNLMNEVSAGKDVSFHLKKGKNNFVINISGQEDNQQVVTLQGKNRNGFVISFVTDKDKSIVEEGTKPLDKFHVSETKDEAKDSFGVFAIRIGEVNEKVTKGSKELLANTFGGKNILKTLVKKNNDNKSSIINKSDFINLIKNSSDLVKKIKSVVQKGEKINLKSIEEIKDKIKNYVAEVKSQSAGGFNSKLINNAEALLEDLSALRKPDVEFGSSINVEKLSALIEDLEKTVSFNQLPIKQNIVAIKNELKKVIGSTTEVTKDEIISRLNAIISDVETSVKTTGKISEKEIAEINKILPKITSEKVKSNLQQLVVSEEQSDVKTLLTRLKGVVGNKSEVSLVGKSKILASKKLNKLIKNLDETLTKSVTSDKEIKNIGKEINAIKDGIAEIINKNGEKSSTDLSAEKVSELVSKFEKKLVAIFSDEEKKISVGTKNSVAVTGKVEYSSVAKNVTEPKVKSAADNSSSGNSDESLSEKDDSAQNHIFAKEAVKDVSQKQDSKIDFVGKLSASMSQSSTLVKDNPVQGKFQNSGLPLLTKEELINNFSTIVKGAKEKSITLQLKPENLGKVKVTLSTVNNDTVRASIQVENHIVKQFVENNLAQLYSQMSKTGVQFSSVNVSVSQNPFTKDSGSNGSHQKKGNKNNLETEEFVSEKEIERARAFGYNTYEFLA